VFFLTAASLTLGQEALRNLLVDDAAVEARHLQAESQRYTIKSDDLRLLVVPSLGLDWNDNVNISRTNAQQDVIFRPRLQLAASYPITQENLLSLNVGVGYDKYFEHDQYSTLFLQTGSELSFDIYVKDFWFNLHDRVNYVQDTSQQPALSGIANYATLDNTAGLSVTWDLDMLRLSTGYDHQNVISPRPQPIESQDGVTEMLFARAGLKLYPEVTTGIEGTGAFTTYDQMVLNDNSAYSAGVYADWQPGEYFHVQPRVGYTTYHFQHTSQTIQTSDLNTWYGDLRITHQVTHAIGYSLDVGHEVRYGFEADAIEDSYFRPSVHWDIIKNLILRTSLNYEHGKQGVGNVAGNLAETYDWFSTEVGASYSMVKNLSLDLAYRLSLRSSNIAYNEYAQNVLTLQVSYNPS
jgi:hypothetical protein